MNKKILQYIITYGDIFIDNFATSDVSMIFSHTT